MSSTLWAIEAARKNKGNEILPGSSRHITAEMQTNLEIAKNGILAFNDKLLACVVQLNDIIDGINSGASPELIEKVAQMSLANYDVKDENSTMSGNSLTWLRSDRSFTEGPSRPELKLELSEKVLLQSDRQLLSSDALLPKKPDQLTYVINREEEMPPTVEKPVEADLQQGNEVNGDTARLPPYPENQQTQRAEETPVALPPSMEPKNAGAPKLEEIVTAPLSPIHIPRTTAQLTSPNVDLSFIPIANSINPQKFDKTPDVKAELEEESDTSFQAISTAIRKSFAGKLSMGQLAGSLPLYSDYKDMENGLISNELSSNHQDHPTTGSETNSTNKAASQKPRPRQAYAKRSSVFVALPDREPISYLNSRQSIKVKTEEDQLKSKRSLVLPRLTSEHTVFQAPEDSSASARSLNIANNLNLRNPNQSAKRTDSKAARSKIKSVSSAPGELNLKPKSANLRMGTIPKMSPTKNHVRSRSPVLVGDKSKPPVVTQRRFTSRTTESGSPSRRVLADSTPSAISRDGVNGRITNKVVLKREEPSSVESSRSPTKYSYRADLASDKNSPTDYRALSPVVKEEPKSSQKVVAPIGSRVSKPPTAKEKQFKNRFLTTTLNPENPPQFIAVKSQPRRASPVKKVPSVATERTKIDRKVDRKIPSVSLKFEPSSRPKQKINLSISHAQEARENTARVGTSPTERLVTSPKRARTMTDKLELSSRKSIKRLEPVDIHVAPRKRAVGNAVPLPDAARGIFTNDRNKEKRKNKKSLVTPSRAQTMSRKSLADLGATAGSPQYGPNALPDIPSDDEALKSRKYLKSWAETPQLLRAMKENKDLDPVAVFGDVPVLKMDDVFESAASRQRGMASPRISP